VRAATYYDASGSPVGEFTAARRVLDRQDDNLLVFAIYRVIDEISVFRGDKLRTPAMVYRRPISGNRVRVCKDDRSAWRTAKAASGFRARR
jgi:hypothetical protein